MKTDTENSAGPLVQNDVQDIIEVTPIKKKRGRPKKVTESTGLVVPPKKEPTDEKEDFDSQDVAMELERDNLEVKIAEYFTPEVLKKIKRVTYYTARVGLVFDEACKLSRTTSEEFAKWMNQSPELAELMSIKELEYKADMMAVLAARARKDGGDKVAQWLLQTKGVGPKKGTGNVDGDDDIIAAGIEFVRKNGDSNGMVGEESGRAFVVKKSTDTTIASLQSLLK